MANLFMRNLLRAILDRLDFDDIVEISVSNETNSKSNSLAINLE